MALQTDGKILVGGGFNSIGGQARNNIARLDPVTGLADSFNPNANEEVLAIALDVGGKILVGGYFNGTNSIGGQRRNFIARLDPATGLADSFDPNASDIIKALMVQADGRILVGGGFHGTNGIGGQRRTLIARLDPVTGLADSFDPNANRPLLPGSESVTHFAVQADGKVLVGGDFTGLAPNGGRTNHA